MKKYQFVIVFIFIFIVSSPLNTKAATTFTNGRIKYEWIKIKLKNCPSTSCGVVTSKTGSAIRLDYPDTFEILGEENGYYYIQTYFGGYIYKGYASKAYIDATRYTTNDNYKNSLKAQGFPEDYAEKLSKLHAIHPNWTFTISKTGDQPNGMDFNYAVNGETKDITNNLVNGNDESLRSREPGSYNGSWITYSGGWYAASKQTVAFFMDPRNFLDETFVFMFENLSYDSTTQTSDVVKKITANTFMENSFLCTINSNNCSAGTHTYEEAFVATGKSKGLSPVALAVRVLQEQGTNGSTLSKGEGYNGNYVGYYNLFNVYANGNTTSDVINNGLAYAQQQNWNNPYASILAGATLLSDKYIRVGQNTLYYQKFDTVGSYMLFEHQYMQNVKAPFSESYNTNSNYRYAYVNSKTDTENIVEWNNSKFNFIIPIYSNMPAYTSLSEAVSNDNTLKSLNVSNCTAFNPGFDPNALTYDCYVENNINSVNITASATHNYAKVSGTGNVNITSDNITKEIIVTAADTTKRTYKINIHKLPKKAESKTNLSIEESLKKSNITIKDNYISNFSVGSNIDTYVNKIKSYNTNVMASSTGLVKTGDTITINNSQYIVVLYGDANGDGKINSSDLLKLKKHVLNQNIINGTLLKASDVNKDGKVNSSDLLLLQKYILGKSNISQS